VPIQVAFRSNNVACLSEGSEDLVEPVSEDKEFTPEHQVQLISCCCIQMLRLPKSDLEALDIQSKIVAIHYREQEILHAVMAIHRYTDLCIQVRLRNCPIVLRDLREGAQCACVTEKKANNLEVKLRRQLGQGHYGRVDYAELLMRGGVAADV
jgi:hypothetical protein